MVSRYTPLVYVAGARFSFFSYLNKLRFERSDAVFREHRKSKLLHKNFLQIESGIDEPALVSSNALRLEFYPVFALVVFYFVDGLPDEFIKQFVLPPALGKPYISLP